MSEDQQSNSSQEQNSDQEQNQEQKKAPTPPSPVEWSVRLFSLLLLVGLFVYLIWMATRPLIPITFDTTLQMDQLEQRQGSWVLPFEIVNQSNRSLTDLTVSIELINESGEVEEKEEVLFGLIGHGEKKTADLWFSEDPSNFERKINIGSYKSN